MTMWISIEQQLPPEETPVLLVRRCKIAIGERRWEHPTFEECFKSFWVWCGADDEWCDDQGENYVTHWMAVPELPSLQIYE